MSSRILCWFVWIAIVPIDGKSQTSADLKILSESYSNSKKVYFDALDAELGIHNGVSYKEYVSHESDQGHPYFKADEWTDGSVFYNGMYYDDIPLLYDVVNDKLITTFSNSVDNIELIPEKVKYFVISSHQFVRLSIPDTQSPVQSGYYEILYDGQSKLYAKWKKERKSLIESHEIYIQYEEQNSFYLFKDNKFVRIKSKSSFLEELKDKKSQLQKFIRANNLNFKKQPAESFSKTLSFYESGSE